MDQKTAAAVLKKIKENIELVIVGKSQAIDRALICLACGGHALIEDVPGLGKTSLVQALAESVGCSFQRIQFTPDVLPSDVTGFTLFHPGTGEKEFYPGAVMSQIVLADEINRTSPKTQSALLQAMQEGAVTVDGVTHKLDQPFMVCATQNPVGLTGTYPLPEAQLDRFLMRIPMGYPEPADEITILERNRDNGKSQSVNPGQKLSPVVSTGDILALREAVNKVTCTRAVLSYIVDLAGRTRIHKDVTLGASPRASIALMKASMGHALLSGRNYVLPDDVQAMAEPVLAHRIVMDSQAFVQNQTAQAVLSELLREAPVPAVSSK